MGYSKKIETCGIEKRHIAIFKCDQWCLNSFTSNLKLLSNGIGLSTWHN